MKDVVFNDIPFIATNNKQNHNSGLEKDDLYIVDLLAPENCYMKYDNAIVERIVLFLRDQVDNYRIIFQDSIYAPIIVGKNELRNTLEVCDN